MPPIANIRPVFTFFLNRGWKSRRTRVFFLLSLIPFLILLAVKIVQILSPDFKTFLYQIFSQAVVPFYFTMFIQFIALFFGSSVINDERESKTLIYLTTTQTPKLSILLGKFTACYILSALIVLVGFVLCFVVSYVNRLTFASMELLLGLTATAALSLLVYSAFFCALGTLFRKSILFGIFFILGWENVIQYFPGSTQKFSLNHYVKSLLPVELPKKGGFLSFNLQPSSTLEALIVISLLTLIFLTIAILIFQNKEYDLSDQV